MAPFRDVSVYQVLLEATAHNAHHALRALTSTVLAMAVVEYVLLVVGHLLSVTIALNVQRIHGLLHAVALFRVVNVYLDTLQRPMAQLAVLAQQLLINRGLVLAVVHLVQQTHGLLVRVLQRINVNAFLDSLAATVLRVLLALREQKSPISAAWHALAVLLAPGLLPCHPTALRVRRIHGHLR